jgi:hypothetical protein
MKGYKCDIPINELNKLREAFWGSILLTLEHKIKKSNIWRHIKQVCIMDEIRARNLLQAYNLTPVDGCINDLQDSQGKSYHIPNFCINDPYFEKELKSEEEKHISKKLNIKLNEVYGNKTYSLEVEDKLTGLELKQQFCKLINISSTKPIRAFFGGTEILNENSLYRYNIKSNYTIIIMIKDQSNLETNESYNDH